MALPAEALPVEHGVNEREGLSEDVDAAVLGFVERHALPGLGVALVDASGVVFTGAYGWAELESERPLTVETPVLLASVSKTFIAVAAMQAVEDDVLSLDDPIADLVGFDIDNPKVEGETIRLRHALTHNSGIRDSLEYDRSYVVGDPAIGLREFEQGYLTRGGDYWRSGNYAKDMPGERFAYSNVAAALAALAVGEAKSMPYMDLVAARILEPLGMNNSAFTLAGLEIEPAVPYASTTKAGVFRPWPHYGFPTYPDGLMRSSTDDMARYLAAIVGGGSLDGVEILSPDSVDEMLRVDPSSESDEDGQAIVWAQRDLGGRELMGHNGGDFGSLAEMWFDPKTSVGVVVLLHAEPDREGWTDLLDLELELLDLVEGSA